MIVDCIADLHGHYPKLEGGDLLIVAGDLTARDEAWEYIQFGCWLNKQNYRKKIIIAGNHDNIAQKAPPFIDPSNENKYEWDYLCDSGTEFSYHIDGFPEEDEGFLPSGKMTLKIWGSPWTKTFKGMNPHCKAFTVDTEDELAEKWALIPDDIDILVTHSPPYGVMDVIDVVCEGHTCDRHVGSESLALKIGKMENPPKLWIWGHIHEDYGVDLPVRNKPCIMVNASHVNEHYKPVNKPIRVIL